MRSPATLNTQTGSALLAMMLVFVVSASFVLVSKLNSSVQQFSRQGSSLSELNEAKNALIAYAVNYPEVSGNPNGAPGTLPCPDINNNGSAGANCSFPATAIGRFPYATLETHRARDYSGEELWYIVADNFRTPQVAAINSDTAGNLNVDGTNDIVAVLIAPGPALAGQTRASAANQLDDANYLEGDNANADVNFVSRAAGQFNDTVVIITRQELMQAVEKRVLGEVSQSLAAHQTSNAAYPWLSPFANPTASSFRGTVATDEGHLPYHWSADPDSVAVGTGLNIAGRNPFTTNYDISWSSVQNATLAAVSDTDAWLTLAAPTQACVENSQCANGSDPFNGQVPSVNTINAASCTWSDKDSFGCPAASFVYSRIHTVWDSTSIYGYKNSTTGAAWDWFWTDTSGVDTWEIAYFPSGGAAGWGTFNVDRVVQGTLTRTYAYTISFSDQDGIVENSPTAASQRTRNLDLTGTFSAAVPAASMNLTVTDDFVPGVQYPNYNITNMQATHTLTSDADTTGTLAANNLLYDLDVDDGELPQWFVGNGWQELIYLSYASGEPVPGSTVVGQDCNTLPGSCLTVVADGLTNTATARAVAISAGVDLTPGASPRPNGTLTDYFEGENSSPIDDAFIKNDITIANNDQTRIIAVAP